jgi:hypothetical protein
MSRTLIFCTSYSASAETWTMRYRLWLNAVLSGDIRHDHIVIMDDASPVLPDWSDTRIITNPMDAPVPGTVSLFHFNKRLGRQAGTVYPGWSRSFAFAARFAISNGFEKVVHIESDAFIISPKMTHYINDLDDGWVAPSIISHEMPESAIQIIAGESMRSYHEFSDMRYSPAIGIEAEHVIPFTHIERRFKGSRYGETMTTVPRDADFVTQARPAQVGGRDYYWWLKPDIFPFP